MQRFTHTLAVLTVLASASQAQEVTFRGKVEDVQGTFNQFFLDCTDTQLTSAAFNLNPFVGQVVEISGQWNGSGANPSVDVTAIAPATETFEIGGGAKLGEVSTLGFTGAPGSNVLGFVSLAPSFVPFDGNNTVLIDLNQTVVTRTGTIGGTGIVQLGFGIPNNPALGGLEIYGQGGILQGGAWTLTNPDCKEIDN